MEKKSLKDQRILKKTDPPPKCHTPLKNDEANIQYGGMASVHDDVPLLMDGFPETSKCSKIIQVVCNLTIEPVMFSFMFAFMMNITVYSNMIMDKGCLYYYNYSREICRNLSAYHDEKEKVEILGNNYSLYSSLTMMIAAVTMIFIAPWSDKYGRKPPLVVAVFGVLITDVGLMLNTLYFDARLEYLILARIPGELFGGFICVLTIVYSHASEVSTEKNRTIKYTCIEIAFGLGMALGGLTAGFLYQYYGYFYVYLTGAVLHLFCAPWTIFVVQETTGLGIKATWKDKLRDFFDCESLKKSFKATIRKREGYDRCLLWLLIASMCCYVILYEAYGSIGYIYAHHIYNWNPSIYSKVYTTSQLIQLALILMIVPVLVDIFKTKDSFLGIIGTLSMMTKNVLFAFARPHEYIYYAGLLSGFLATTATLAMRAVISKIVEKEELGRVFSFLATCEAVVPMLGNIGVAKLFNATIDVYPSITYLISVLFASLPLFTFFWAHKVSKKKYSAMTQDKNTYDPINEKS